MKVLYIAPEYPSAGRTAAQVRANALLPQLAQRTDLQILAYPPPDGLSGRLLDDCTTSVERAAPGKLALLCATYARMATTYSGTTKTQGGVWMSRLHRRGSSQAPWQVV